jgi:UDPglucose--hexose-1-phosphate uridylyltransferase
MPAMTWERRWHPLREEWVIVAAHRQHRPWTGAEVGFVPRRPDAYDPACYLCPGNPRVSGRRNPAYRDVFVFDNDHPCVAPDAPAVSEPVAPPFSRAPARGLARVVCYTPRHDLTLAEMGVEGVDRLLAAWQDQYRDLAAREGIAHVLMFENKGEVIGVSNPHPHGQIYATDFVFTTTATEARASARHLADTGRVLLADVLAAEEADGRRVLWSNASAVAFVPFFARYAYEVFVAPRRTVPHVAALDDGERRDLARVLARVLVAYDNLWRMPFPYVLALHQAPTAGADGFHFHLEFHPPLRQPHLLKYLAGPEIGGGTFLSDTAPEEKAAELRAQPEVHYRQEGVP